MHDLIRDTLDLLDEALEMLRDELGQTPEAPGFEEFGPDPEQMARIVHLETRRDALVRRSRALNLPV